MLVYKIQISLAKISVCLFLLRIFQFRAFYYITYVVVGLNAAIGIAWVFADAFQCDPVHLAWTGWEKLEPGTCIDFNTSTVINAFVNIAVDFAMVLMPIYEVSKLNMSKSKKLGVALVFAVGLVYACSFSILSTMLTRRDPSVVVVAILRVVVLYRNSHWESSTGELALSQSSSRHPELTTPSQARPRRPLVHHRVPGHHRLRVPAHDPRRGRPSLPPPHRRHHPRLVVSVQGDAVRSRGPRRRVLWLRESYRKDHVVFRQLYHFCAAEGVE